MATVNTEIVALAGLDVTYAAASGGGDKFTPGERTFLYVKNGDASPTTVTVVTPGTVVGQAVDDVEVTVPAGEERFIGPFPTEHFRGSDGLVDITWSNTTAITFAVLRA